MAGRHGGATLTVEDPSTGEALCNVADASPGDAMAALDAASEVQEGWKHHPPRERGEILRRRAFGRITERADELALLMTLRMGKPVAELGGEILYAAEYGLVAYVYTLDPKRALRVCEGLQTGILGLNRGLVSDAAAPFGGIKYSGFGREGGHEGIAE